MTDAVVQRATKKVMSSDTEARVRIILEDNENIPPTGLGVGVNGRHYIIRPGFRVDVPKSVVGVLRDAIIAAPIVDALTKKMSGTTRRMRFPFRELRPGDADYEGDSGDAQ